ncbi:MAG TPA: NAD(P)H-dependent glycerol-3-phosphate dehydrogenase [Terracidiphilus sp.]|nr:NAD(P)H-dependent glycerol-3-phosphate dehydrogenase [Terracidiphilus sp.]
MSRIAVLGSGAWGTAIALALHRRGGHQVTLWSHSAEEANQIVAAGENTLFLPGFPLPKAIAFTADGAPIGEAEIVVSVIPSEFLRPTLDRLRPYFHPGQVVVSATKGVENNTYLRMTQVIASSLGAITPQAELAAARAESHALEIPAPNPDTRLEVFVESTAPEVSSSGIEPAPRSLDDLVLPIGAFSGPSFALEVAQGQPTAVTVAFDDPAVAARIQHEFSSETLRLYTSTDVIGVELGGALKNVIAIAAGVAAGMGLGYNSAAALMTRGIAEITRLAVACGGRRETLAGLSGVGDLVLTCTGSLSRNRTVGHALGQGRKLPEILESLGGKVAEGVLTTRAALGLARRHQIEMPITEQMELILDEGKDPREAIKDLMLRPGKHEH